MTMVTRQNILAEKTRFMISVGGIALAVFLIAFLLSLYQGWNLSVGRFVENVDTDIWVARDGTPDFLAAASILGTDVQDQVSQMPNVESVQPLIVRPMEVEMASGKREGMHFIGYDVATGAGGPPKVTKGKSIPGENEIIVDEAFAKKANVGVGDTLTISDQQLTIVGESTGGNLVFSQTTFTSLETARRLLAMENLSTFYLVTVQDGASAKDVAAQIDQTVPDVSAYTKGQFAKATRDRIMRNMIPILVVILILAFVVGVSITGLTIYNAAVEKQREYGILKALGFTNGYLFRLVLEQSLATGILSFIIGAGLTAVASRFISDLVPQFVTLLRWQDMLFVLVTTLLMSTLSSLLPVRRIAGVDPVSVFS